MRPGEMTACATKLQPLGGGIRYYEASTGTLKTMDPIPGNTAEPLSLHKYTYCHGNPVMYSDPTGMFTLPQLGVTIGIVTALVTVGYLA